MTLHSPQLPPAPNYLVNVLVGKGDRVMASLRSLGWGRVTRSQDCLPGAAGSVLDSLLVRAPHAVMVMGWPLQPLGLTPKSPPVCQKGAHPANSTVLARALGPTSWAVQHRWASPSPELGQKVQPTCVCSPDTHLLPCLDWLLISPNQAEDHPAVSVQLGSRLPGLPS